MVSKLYFKKLLQLVVGAIAKDETICKEPVDFSGFSKEELWHSHTEVSPNTNRLVARVLAFESTAGCSRIAHIPAADSKSLGEKEVCNGKSISSIQNPDFPFPQRSTLQPGSHLQINSWYSVPRHSHCPGVCRVMKSLSFAFSRSHAFYGQ